MNILVAVSHVPDTTAKIVVAASGTQIDASGIKFICNPYDEYAIEEGLRLREKHGGSVTVVTCGPDAAKDVLRTALAMGADKAILVKDAAKSDSFSVASSIAAVATSVQADIVLLGRQSIDYDSFQMAPTVAELLSQPSVSMVSSLNIDGSDVRAERDIEGGKEQVETSLPCVISVQKGINDPRYPKL
ncbi:MAG: electron transfer flavoprotein subunit beta/FixA family protein, partial [Candidatus Kapaibacterium sp.]